MAGLIVVLLFTSASSNPITLKQEGYLQIMNAETVPLRQYIFFNNATGIRISGDHSSISIPSVTNDEVLMLGSAPSNSSRLHRVLGSNFLQEITMIKTANAENINTLSPNQWLTRPKRRTRRHEKEQRINLVRRHIFYTKHFPTLQDSYVDPLKKFLATNLAVSLLL